MITLRRAEGRHHDRRGKQEAWLTFFHTQDGAEALADGFGTLRLLSEERLAAGATVPERPARDTEVVTYVREGALTFRDALGQSGVIQAGEFQRATSASPGGPGEMRASRSDRTQAFRLWLGLPQGAHAPSCEQKRFTAAQRRGRLCLVASPDGSGGSLGLQQDTSIYSAVLDVGDHVVHALAAGRGAWLHVVRGALTMGDIVLTSGDGAGIAGEHAVSLTARDESEILLLDLDPGQPPTPENGGTP